MGDPKKQRRRYSRPKHPWKAERISEEGELCKKYGLKNKKEVWRAKSTIGRFRQQARLLLGLSGEELEKEKRELLDKLNKLGILETRSLDDVLALTVEDLLERRLQTLVYRKGMANTIRQARQLVVHGHVLVGDSIVNVPGYIVPKDKEENIKISERIKVVNLGKRREEGKEVSKEAG